MNEFNRFKKILNTLRTKYMGEDGGNIENIIFVDHNGLKILIGGNVYHGFKHIIVYYCEKLKKYKIHSDIIPPKWKRTGKHTITDVADTSDKIVLKKDVVSTLSSVLKKNNKYYDTKIRVRK